MNLKTMLLASAAALFATQANAADITNPFYLPTEGHFYSETKVAANRTHVEKSGVLNEHAATYAAGERLYYGLTDNWSVYGGLDNYFMHDAEKYDLPLNNDHNFLYTLGTAYNIHADRWLVQLHAEYQTLDPRSWFGKDKYENNRWVKIFNTGVKLGYEAGCGFTPYTTFDVEGNFDDNKRWLDYSWFVGAHKQVDKVAVDAGVRYDFSKDGRFDKDETWTAEADVDYYVRDNIAVGVFGDYYLGGKGHHYVKYDFTLGLALKAAF